MTAETRDRKASYVNDDAVRALTEILNQVRSGFHTRPLSPEAEAAVARLQRPAAHAGPRAPVAPRRARRPTAQLGEPPCSDSSSIRLGMPLQDLSDLHPVILEALLERSWNQQVNSGSRWLATRTTAATCRAVRISCSIRSSASQVARALAPARRLINVPLLDRKIRGVEPGGPIAPSQVRWQHLIYAYMIENTRALEVFRRVLDSFLHGERLSALGAGSQRWLRTTEELFFRDPPSFSTTTQTSYVRPNLAATRANAYQRLFGMTLNATDGGKPNFIVAEHANGDFVQVFDELLHELWQGRSNFANAVGARPTDDAKIAAWPSGWPTCSARGASTATSRARSSSRSRRMSWFHAVLETDTHPIIVDLRASASSPEERLFKIAQRVGYPAHGLSKSYFETRGAAVAAADRHRAEDVQQPAGGAGAVHPLPPAPPGGPAADTDIILTHWSIIRGRDAKAKKVATV